MTKNNDNNNNNDDNNNDNNDNDNDNNGDNVQGVWLCEHRDRAGSRKVWLLFLQLLDFTFLDHLMTVC